MNANSPYLNTWSILGALGGAGFGFGVVPLLYILINMFSGGVTLWDIVYVAVGNGFTWGVLGLIAGAFASVIWGVYDTAED